MAHLQAIRKEVAESQIRRLSRPVQKLSATLLALALFTAGYAQPLDKAKLDQFFDRLAEKNKAMGSLVLAKDGEVVYSRAIGYSRINGNEKLPLTTTTRQRIGSITKMFTAVMVLQLIEEGKLQPADHLDKFFHQVPNAGKITIGQILAHRSGIHDVNGDRELRPSSKTNPVTRDELLARIARGQPDFEPGTKYAYSNSGYAILGLIIEKVTGKTYEEALKERITTKLGLKDTYVAAGNADVSKNESLSYRHIGDWKQDPETHPGILFGAGSIISTPNDLARFIKALFDLQLLSRESLSIMTTMKDGQGAGMDTFTFGGKTFYGHTGGVDGFGAWLAYQPEEKLAVAYTANGKVYPVANIINGVLNIYWHQPFQVPTFETVAVSPETLDRYTGVYASPGAPMKFTVSRNGDTLFMQPNGESAIPLEPVAENKFRIDGVGMVLEFDAAKSQVTVKRKGGARVFTKEN